MKTSSVGIQLIAEFEGFPNGGRPYNDPVGLATVGFGHLIARRRVNDSDRRATWLDGQRRPGVLTLEEAKALLRHDLAARERAVERMARVPLTQGQFDGLVSLVFNIGEGNLERSTVMRRVNQGDYRGAADAFMMWNKAGNPLRVLEGLTRRRTAERARFLAGADASSKGASTADDDVGFTARELAMITEYDQLVHDGRDPQRRGYLIEQMTLQRKRIWRRAQPTAKGGDGGGWGHADRRPRYRALYQRTRKR